MKHSPLFLLLITILLATTLTFSSPLVWSFSDWYGDCSQSQCGYGVLWREASCFDTSTGATIDPKNCFNSLGQREPVTTMECVYSPPQGQVPCGGAFGKIAYNCNYNPDFDPEADESLYMLCSCKEGYSGERCEVGPKPDPNPDPKPDPDDNKKTIPAKIIFGAVIILLVFALVGFGFLIFKKIQAKKAHSSATKNPTINGSDTSVNGPYINMDETIYS